MLMSRRSSAFPPRPPHPSLGKRTGGRSEAEERRHPWRSNNPLVAFRHAANGIGYTLRTQRNLRFHCLACFAVLIAGLLLGVGRLEMLALLLAVGLVLVAELFNTVVETVVDLITTEYHPAAKVAKDVAAGAVLLAAVTAAAVGLIVFGGWWQRQ